jgi:FkbM family methyltransferase
LAKDSLASFGGLHLRITDGPNFYMQYKDEFIRRIYHFDTEQPDPKIIDGGGNMGMSILYFKRIYPKARIISFEPDPQIHSLLTDNLHRNGIHDVQVINAGLAAVSGTASFSPDTQAGGRIAPDATGQRIRVERLSDYLAEPVDFLKLNIEGMELPVLQEAATAGKLKNVRHLLLEYHGWPNGKQCLGEILTLLDQQGFRYLVHDFDAETCGATKPPFRLSPQTTWFCLVYAKQMVLAS